MIKQIRIESVVGLITLLWAITTSLSHQPSVVIHLSDVMSDNGWSFSGFIIGSAQIYLSRNPDMLNTTLHWFIAFLSATFWTYLGMAACVASIGVVPTIIFWSTSAATFWELAHVRP